MSTGSDADPDGEPRDGRDGGQDSGQDSGRDGGQDSGRDSGQDSERDGERERELGDFLRSRRAAIDPADVGLPSGPRRRAPGLRREEVALLAGVSVTWYTWLEQGRAERPSRAVLDAVARALRLDDAEHSHLLTLARRAAGDGAVEASSRARRAGEGVEAVDLAGHPPPDALVRTLDALDPAPSYLLGPRWEYLAWNRAQGLLYPKAESLAVEDRNLLFIVLCEPSARELVVDREDEARAMVTEFRASTALLRGDPDLEDLIARLRRESPEFERWWSGLDVAGFHSRLRRYDHPRAGPLTFEYQAFEPAEWPGHRLVTQLPVPGDDSTERLSS
ncbi:MAG: helix-turn-helix domain-containing protein [Microthrixaceae bacterium]|jgi:transcriptional regulator with XRE-family HTH domain